MSYPVTLRIPDELICPLDTFLVFSTEYRTRTDFILRAIAGLLVEEVKKARVSIGDMEAAVADLHRDLSPEAIAAVEGWLTKGKPGHHAPGEQP